MYQRPTLFCVCSKLVPLVCCCGVACKCLASSLCCKLHACSCNTKVHLGCQFASIKSTSERACTDRYQVMLPFTCVHLWCGSVSSVLRVRLYCTPSGWHLCASATLYLCDKCMQDSCTTRRNTVAPQPSNPCTGCKFVSRKPASPRREHPQQHAGVSFFVVASLMCKGVASLT